MPTKPLLEVFARLFLMGEAPWKFSTWKEITGITHGLFPSIDDDLPRGWNRSKADAVLSFIDHYSNLPSDSAKMKFASSKSDDLCPGRKIWKDFISERYNKEWKINSRIISVLTDNHRHPFQIMVAEGLTSFPSVDANTGAILDPVCIALFGDEAFNAHGHVYQVLAEPVATLITHCWDNLRRQTARAVKNLTRYEKEAIASMECAYLFILDSDKMSYEVFLSFGGETHSRATQESFRVC